MIDKDIAMLDIDVDQWRNAQALLLRSAKACRRLVVIHEDGRVLKFRHTHETPVRGTVAAVGDPHGLARDLYQANKDVVDFVVVLERRAVDRYFAQVQNGWTIDDDIDDFVHKTYAALDSYADGIVTYPGPARETLGLQWRLGASHEQVTMAVKTLVAPGSSVILGVESRGELWTSLILDFDDNHQLVSVTTADPSRIDLHGTPTELVERLLTWVEQAGKQVSIALLLDHRAAQDLLAAPADRKADTLTHLLQNGKARLARAPAALATHQPH